MARERVFCQLLPFLRCTEISDGNSNKIFFGKFVLVKLNNSEQTPGLLGPLDHISAKKATIWESDEGVK